MPEINNIPTTQYIGPKIIPHLADPIEWDIDTQYDALSIVQNLGDTYIARYIVPAGTAIDNTTYWTKFAAWNAQIAQYQATVETFDSRISENTADIADEVAARIAAISAETTAREAAITAETTARESADTTLQTNITAEETARISADNTLQGNIDTEATTRANADAALQGSVETLEDMLPNSAFSNVNTVKKSIDDINTYIVDTLDLGEDISFESGYVANKFIYEIFTFPKDKYRIDFKPTVESALVPGVEQTADSTLIDYALTEKPFFAFNVNPTGNFIYNGILYGSDWTASEGTRTGFYGTTANGEIKCGRSGSFVAFASDNNCAAAIPAWQPLIRNGINESINSYTTFTEPNPYPLVAEDNDNLYVFMSFCRFGKFVGMTLAEYQIFCMNRGWPNVYVFDGGGSNQMVTGNPFMKFHMTVGEISYIDRKEKMVCVISKREV